MLWRLASAWGDSPPRNSCTTWRLNSIECVRCLAMGFLLESPVQLADSQGPYLSTSKGALHKVRLSWQAHMDRRHRARETAETKPSWARSSNLSSLVLEFVTCSQTVGALDLRPLAVVMANADGFRHVSGADSDLT